MGDHHTALRHAHTAFELSKQNPGNYSSAMVRNMLASITAQTPGGRKAATHLYQQALTMARAAGGGYPEVTALLGLAEAALNNHEIAEATTPRNGIGPGSQKRPWPGRREAPGISCPAPENVP